MLLIIPFGILAVQLVSLYCTVAAKALSFDLDGLTLPRDASQDVVTTDAESSSFLRVKFTDELFHLLEEEGLSRALGHCLLRAWSQALRRLVACLLELLRQGRRGRFQLGNALVQLSALLLLLLERPLLFSQLGLEPNDAATGLQKLSRFRLWLLRFRWGLFFRLELLQ